LLLVVAALVQTSIGELEQVVQVEEHLEVLEQTIQQ
jgi:hypothetical protein